MQKKTKTCLSEAVHERFGFVDCLRLEEGLDQCAQTWVRVRGFEEGSTNIK